MNDRLPGKPGRYSGVIDPADVQKLQKAEPFAITLTRDDEPIREGTPYSKATVLPDDVAKMLCPEKEDPTPADAFRQLGEGNLGASRDVFVLFPFVVYENAYHGADGNPVDQVGCSVYRLYLGDENERLFGKTIQIKTYAYGDMAYGFEGEPGTKINPGADIVRDPQSGVCEFSVTLPEYNPENNVFFHISFCENPYTGFEIYEKKGTVWEEIKKLQSVEGYDAVESVATAIRYTPQALTEQQKAQTRENIGFSDAVAETMGEVAHQYNSIINGVSGDVISVNDSLNRKLFGLNLYGKTTQDGTPTPDAPVELVNAGSDGEITATITGKNIFGGRALADKIAEVTPNVVDSENGTIGYTGTQIGGEILFDKFKPNTKYTFIIGGITANRTANLKIKLADGTLYPSGSGLKTNVPYTIDSGDVTKGKNIWCLTGSNQTTASRVTLRYDECGIFEGELTEADFVPYDPQTITLSTPNGLRSVGSVTDEIDFNKGVRVTRIGVIDSYAGEEISTDYISSTGELSEGATVQYVLAEPYEKLLTEEELAAYSALHTNQPDTVVTNDGGAGMVLAYVADTKRYIDNKFAQLQNAILSAGANV